MSESDQEGWLNLFKSTEVPDRFASDLGSVFKLTAKARQAVLSFMEGRVPILDDLEEEELEDLAKNTKGATKKDLGNCFKVLHFITQKMALRPLSIEKVLEDLQTLGRTPKEVRTAKGDLEKLLKICPRFESEARTEFSSEKAIDTVDGISFVSDIRAVENDDDEIVGLVPVLLVRIKFSGENTDEVVFQLNERKLEQFCEMFDREKTRLEEYSQRVTLRPKE